jgi:hypothetical protein
MLFQFLAPQGLEGVAAAVHGVQPGEFGMLAAMIAPADPVGADAGIVFLLNPCLSHDVFLFFSPSQEDGNAY